MDPDKGRYLGGIVVIQLVKYGKTWESWKLEKSRTCVDLNIEMMDMWLQLNIILKQIIYENDVKCFRTENLKEIVENEVELHISFCWTDWQIGTIVTVKWLWKNLLRHSLVSGTEEHSYLNLNKFFITLEMYECTVWLLFMYADIGAPLWWYCTKYYIIEHLEKLISIIIHAHAVGI